MTHDPNTIAPRRFQARHHVHLTALGLISAWGLLGCGTDPVTPEPDPDPTPIVEGNAGDPCEPSEADRGALIGGWPLTAEDPAVSAHGADEVTVEGYTHLATVHTSEEGSFHYLDLASGGFAELSDAASLDSSGWHLALRRTDVRFNSGDSGPGAVRIARLTDVRFEDVHTLPSDATWTTDAAEWSLVADESGALSCTYASSRNKPKGAIHAVNADRPLSGSWYHYDLSSHRVRPYRNTVYLVQDGEQTWKLEFSDYSTEGAIAQWKVRWAPLHGEVCNAERAGANVDGLLARRTPVFDYEANGQLHSSEEVDGIWTATVQAGGGGGVFSPINAMTYVDFDQGTVQSFSDFEAAADTDWEIAFRRTAIRFNGGDAGAGAIRVAKLTRDEVALSAEGATLFDDVTVAHAEGNLTWSSDAIAWDWAPGLDDDENEVRECSFAQDMLGAPMLTTAFLNRDNASSGDWYDYGAGIQPLPDTVYVLHDVARDVFWKLELVSYFAGTADGDPTRPVEHRIRWSRLEG
jgi:hypothetical protein